jgi:hypothetical protein
MIPILGRLGIGKTKGTSAKNEMYFMHAFSFVRGKIWPRVRET